MDTNQLTPETIKLFVEACKKIASNKYRGGRTSEQVSEDFDGINIDPDGEIIAHYSYYEYSCGDEYVVGVDIAEIQNYLSSNNDGNHEQI